MIDFSTFTLDNGLRVVHSHDPQTAMVVVNVLYDTGSRDECRRLTGIAHLFEHLMFGGSAHIPDFDKVIEMAGGTDNAVTSNDFTCFYDILPAQNAETAFYLESDRMLGLAFSDKALEVQRSVVIEEFKQTCLNRPYGKVRHNLLPMLYPTHPYGWPVIGIEPAHIARVTQQDVKDWFYRHYAPNNAVLAVTGRISLEETKRLAVKWFGDIPARSIAPRNLPSDPWPTHTIRRTVTDNVPQTAITIAWRMDPYGTPGYFAADAITDVLSAGKSSRFMQRLMLGTDLFTSADASITGSEESGMLIVQARIAREDAESIALAERMLLDEVKQIAEPGNVTEYELERAKNRYEANFTYDNMSCLALAQNLATALYHNEDINNNVPRYRTLRLEDLSRTAQHLFLTHSPAILLTQPQSQDSL